MEATSWSVFGKRQSDQHCIYVWRHVDSVLTFNDPLIKVKSMAISCYIYNEISDRMNVQRLLFTHAAQVSHCLHDVSYWSYWWQTLLIVQQFWCQAKSVKNVICKSHLPLFTFLAIIKDKCKGIQFCSCPACMVALSCVSFKLQVEKFPCQLLLQTVYFMVGLGALARFAQIFPTPDG